MSHRLPLQDIAFISEFAAFCRGRPAGEEYDFQSWSNCAVCQFLRTSGRASDPEVLFTEWGQRRTTRRHKLPEALWSLHSRNGPKGILPEGVQTFSALADRLEALLADAPKVLGE